MVSLKLLAVSLEVDGKIEELVVEFGRFGRLVEIVVEHHCVDAVHQVVIGRVHLQKTLQGVVQHSMERNPVGWSGLLKEDWLVGQRLTLFLRPESSD